MFDGMADWECFDEDAHDNCENFIDEEYVEIDECRMFIHAYKDVLNEMLQRKREEALLAVRAEEKKTILEQMDEQPWNKKLEVDVLKFEPDKVDISKELQLFREEHLKECFRKCMKEKKNDKKV